MLLTAVLLAGVSIGSVTVHPGDTLRIISAHLSGGSAPVAPQLDSIIWTLRAPRVVLGAAVGAGLAVVGMVMQALVRNPLADPYILGVNSGASAGAAAATLFGLGAGFGSYALQGSAFIGAGLAAGLLLLIARAAGRVTSTRLLMAGVAIGYAFSALTSFLIFAADSAEGTRSVMFWLMGSLSLAAWDGALALTVGCVLLGCVLFAVLGRHLDALAIGDETALTLGIRPERFRALLLLVVCLIVGVIVAMAGSIGFIGLVVPHLARRFFGPAHRLSVPAAALIGATLVVGADLLARTLLSPQEIPIGVLTALIGAPFLLILAHRMRPTS